jgi:hypothetical protein
MALSTAAWNSLVRRGTGAAGAAGGSAGFGGSPAFGASCARAADASANAASARAVPFRIREF